MITDPITPVGIRSGGAPGGMWWVAWRQHRLLVVVGVGLLGAQIAAMMVLRLLYDADLRDIGFNEDSCASALPDDQALCSAGWSAISGYSGTWALIRLTLLGLPIAFGALAGAAILAPDRERGTFIFALTQSIGRARWYWTKLVVVVTPLVLAMLVAGLVAQWVVAAPGLGASSPLAIPEFQSVGAVPAALLLLAFGVAVPIAGTVRTLAVAMSLSLGAVAIAVIALGYVGYPYLVPHDRMTSPAADGTAYSPLTRGQYLLTVGFLGPDGEPRTPTCPGTEDESADPKELWAACLQESGIVTRYTDYIDESRRNQLTATLSGVCVLIAGIGFTLGWLQMRRRHR